MFKRTSLPVARSIHYQLIDIQLDEVQQMVHSNDGQVKEEQIFLFSFIKLKMMKSLRHRRRVFLFFSDVDKHTCRLLIRGKVYIEVRHIDFIFIYINK